MLNLEKIFDFEIIKNKQLIGISIAAIILMAFVIMGKVFKILSYKASLRAHKKGKKIIELMFIAFARSSIFIFSSIGIKVAIHFLVLSADLDKAIVTASNVAIIASMAYFFYWLADIPGYWLKSFAQKTETKLDDMLVPIVKKTLRILVICLAVVQVAQVLSDKPITSILAGLGIGGLAVALAAQDTIKNFFGSIVLFVDKPFELGDLMKVDGQLGSVEEVGFRSTRLRTLEGHLVTIPNGELANKTIENIGQRPHIKKIINLGVTYDTTPEKIDEAIYVLKNLLKDHEGVDPEYPPRVFFDEFAGHYLNIKVFFWYHPGDYWKFMNFLSELNLKILNEFNSRDIEFAFPTQTLFMAGDPNRPINNIEIQNSELK